MYDNVCKCNELLVLYRNTSVEGVERMLDILGGDYLRK